MKIAIIGTGYVGLVSGTCFAELGHTVTCIDIDKPKVARLQKGEVPIYEPGLEKLILSNMDQKRLFFTSDFTPTLSEATVVFIAVGTPQDPITGQANLKAVFQCAETIAKHCSNGVVIVTKSTVPVNTHLQLSDRISKANPDLEFHLVSNPEFLREGSAVHDFLYPDRIVVGTNSEEGEQTLRNVYAPLLRHGVPFIFTSLPSAELAKYASNSFLATKIAFINEVANLCEKTGAHIDDVARAMGLDKRIGADFLKAGPGYGGSCFPKDTLALSHTAHQYGAPLTIVDAVIKANKSRKDQMAQRVLDLLNLHKIQKVAVLGVAFKAETDDIRDSPALPIIEKLTAHGFDLCIHDPQALGNAKRELKLSPSVCYDSLEKALEAAEAIVIITEWQAYKSLDLSVLAQSKLRPLIIDLRNIIDCARAQSLGLTCIPIGSTEDNHA
ncbi:MAG: UDP-glucose 6-dehydrogenase [Alphaproteobacteria bacterium]|nr:MAG: UDP-glucose 6-dehydrogenase [Alphaproteobacteria bacterium]